jgi:hypothetical protein
MSGQIQQSTSSSKYQSMAILQSVCFFMIFAAFNAAQSLVGAIPGPAGIGAASFAALYGTYTVLCIPAPKVVEYLGPKLAMVLGAIPYVALVFSFLAPNMCTDTVTKNCWESSSIVFLKLTMGALVGVGAPLLWTGQGIYLARAAAHSARQGVDTSYKGASVEAGSARGTSNSGAPLLGSITIKERTGKANKKFNGIFFSVFQLSGCCGLVVSSLILWQVEGTVAFTYLFWGLGICCAAGLTLMTTCLPNLAPVPKDDENEITLSNDTEEKGVTVFSTLIMCFTEPRMCLLVPNILYNGMSLGFIWFSYNTFAWGSGLGASFIGFGSAAFYLVNSLATQLTGKMAVKVGQMPVMIMAIVLHVLFWLFFMFYDLTAIECDPKGCVGNMTNQVRSCVPANVTFNPSRCKDNMGPDCAMCTPFSLEGDQKCASGTVQCEWLHGNVAAPHAMSVIILFIGSFIFAIGDSVWEGQIPAVLQTLHDSASGRQESAMANLKLWQSLGISIFYALSSVTQDIKLEAVILLVTLGVSSLFLLIAHFKYANFDTGKGVGEGKYSDLE